MPTVILFATGKILNIPKDGGEFLALVFNVSPSQIREIAPSYYERLRDEKLVRVAIAHADAAGNIGLSTMELLEISKPDVIFCCYPTFARRLYPYLPIVGHSGRTVTVHYDDNLESGVMSIEFSEE